MAATTAVRTTAIRPLLRLIVVTLLAVVAIGTTFVLATAYNEAAKWTHPKHEAGTLTPAEYGLQFEDLRLTTEDGLRIAAWYVPSKSGAAIVLLHGLGGNRSGDLAFASDLAARGYGLIIPDLRAHGDSEGSACTLGLLEVRDVRAAVEYLERRPDVDPRRIGMYGGSLGASAAIMSASELPELRAVVADSGFASVDWVVHHQFEMLESVPKWMAPVVTTIGSWQAGVNIADIAPVDRIGRISPRPIMIIHGEMDQTFTADNALLLFDAAGEPKELWIDSTAGHTRLYASDPATYVQRVGGFFDRALGTQAAAPASTEQLAAVGS